MKAFVKTHRKVLLLSGASVSMTLVVIGEIVCPESAGMLGPIGWTINTICWIWADL